MPARRLRDRRSLAAAAVLTLCCALSARAEAPDFRRDIAPILETRCVRCHQAEKRRGKLALDSREAALAGGRDGPAVVPGAPDESPLWLSVSGTEPKMPKSGPALKPAEVEAIRSWIEAGAEWPADGRLVEREPTTDWWSLRPLERPAVPEVSPEDAAWARTPIDAFVLRRLRDAGLAPSEEASPRTLARRLTFDLTGLPPTSEQVARLESSAEPEAFEKLVDELLSSPRHGERFGRHWLDVVHYGDTHGYDKDKLRPNAWPYRDYVVRAFNDDKPYSRFVREQLAGDALWPETRDGVVATGFIAAGPWDFIGHAEVPETKTDGKIARLLDRDDMVANTLNTFTSVTIQCARCHDHKFDPVTQEHYYSLQAVFAALDRADRPYDPDPETAERRKAIGEEIRALEEQRDRLQRRLEEVVGPRLAQLDERIKEARSGKLLPPSPAFGWHSQIASRPDEVKWVQVDLGTEVELEWIAWVPCHDDFNGIGDGFGYPPRFRVEIAADADFTRGVEVVVDETTDDVENPGVRPQSVEVRGRHARFVRVTATRLAPRQNDWIFALAELLVIAPDGRNLAAGATVTSLDSIEAPPRWRRANLVDGLYPGASESVSPVSLARLDAERRELLAASTPPALAAEIEAVEARLRDARERLEALPTKGLVYAGTIHHGSGAFRGTGPDGGKPRPIHVLARGDVRTPGVEVGPGTVPLVDGVDWRFDLRPDHAESDRRVALADWIVDDRNGLTWRSIANRVWQWHFGRGLVDSPNDFGRMGEEPTHPELLDWLAAEIRENGGSLKSIHRLIVTSSVYRQSSARREECASVDGGNRLLWRANRRRLDAESIRDAVLWSSGALRVDMFGPGFQDFVIEKPEHSPHYRYDKHDPDAPETHRRAVYRFLVRSQQEPFMTTLDCADPSRSVAKRDETLTALQALALLNNKLMLAMSERFAESLATEAADDASRVEIAFRRAIGRAPSAEEHAALVGYAEAHGLANACRVIFNLNEFVFVD